MESLPSFFKSFRGGENLKMGRGGYAVVESDQKEDFARLGMESRSILKSIQTEESKLAQSPNFTRSDLHYFRARHNYYRLSLLRLPADERILLEPFLARFFERIIAFERLDGGFPERSPAPFIHSVERAESLRTEPIRVEPAAQVSAPLISLNSEILAQLELIRLALTAETTIESKRILCGGVDSLISRIKAPK